MSIKLMMATLLSLFLMTNSYAQGWEQLYYGDTISVHSIEETADGGFFIAGSLEHDPVWGVPMRYSNGYLIKTDVNGDTLWTKIIDGIKTVEGIKIANGGYAVLGEMRDAFAVNGDYKLIKTDVNGDTLWTEKYTGLIGGDYRVLKDVIQTTDGGYLLAGNKGTAVSGTHDAYWIKTDGNGDTLWTQTTGVANPYSEYINSVVQTTDGGYLLAGTSSGNTQSAYLVKTDVNGDTLWTKKLNISNSSMDEALSVIQTTDGGYLLAGKTTIGGLSDACLIKTDTNGNSVWSRTFGGTGFAFAKSVLETVDGGYLFVGETVGKIYVVKTDTLGAEIWSRTFGNLHWESGVDGVLAGNGYAVVGLKEFSNNQSRSIHLIRLDSLGYIYTNYIKGNIYNDLNLNCTKEVGESNISNIVVRAVGNKTWYGTTDSIGNYCIQVDTGAYTVIIDHSIYWQPCANSISTVFPVGYINDTINFPLQAQINCPLMEVDLSAPFLRVLGGGSNYTVNYCNKGTVDASNVSIDVDVDSDLNVLSSSIPVTSQVGNNLSFNIGNVAYGDCGSFTIQVAVDSTAILGQTHCSQADIYPDSLCLPNNWTGPIIDPSATCQNDSIVFKLENIGGSLFNSETYYIVEDHFIMRTGNTGNIPMNGSFDLTIPADTGKTYRISVPQNFGFPKLLGDTIASATIEGCIPYLDGTFNTGFITQFSNGNSSPFIAVDCQPNIFSYDPNDKSAQPAGYDAPNYIYSYTDLDYKIRFQNTGTDTAFLVVIRDTISPLLDLTTLTMGASSHSYTWRVYGERVLEITYENILLPDSTVNEPASNGFVRYRIEQKDGNVSGDVIYNAADIYFDFNAPIRTNQTFHTIGENFVTIMLSQSKLLEENIAVKVYPNPFTQMATLEVEGKDYKELQLTIYDLSGRIVVEKQAYSNNRIELSRGNLQPGVYLYQLLGDDQLINTGKIVVQ